ncbi:MAG: tRNA-dihydrouridine synthase family protein [Candidatus Berkelbacteria bacterium]|nr:tRNA-dihydrouridine synthase family protein [Candidatus Berkelbacteria bacterium]
MSYWFKKVQKPIIGLAPMHQVSRADLRKKCIKFGADVTYSEMVAAEAVIRNVPQAFEMMKFSKLERPFVIQIFGSNPDSMAKAAEIIETQFKPDGIDINFGCPVQKAEKQGFGACQLQDAKTAGKIVAAVSSVLKNTPLSAKIRIPSKDIKQSLNFVNEIYQNGIKMIAIHGRYPEQKYRGLSDWTFAYEVKKRFPDLIVLGNGDIHSLDDLKNKLDNLDGALIGRAAKVKPEIFKSLSQIKK